MKIKKTKRGWSCIDNTGQTLSTHETRKQAESAKRQWTGKTKFTLTNERN